VSKTGRLFEIDSPKLGPSGKPLISDGSGKSVEVDQITVENGKAVFHDKTNKVIPKARPLLSADLTDLSKAGPGSGAVVQRFVIGGLAVFVDPFGNAIEFEPGEAGFTGAVLEAQKSTADKSPTPGSLVYYGITVNDVYAYFLTGVKNGVITPTTISFPTKHKDLTAITNFAKDHGKIFTDHEAKTLTIELKTAWVQASSVANPDTYITMEATIPTYDTSNPSSWVPNGQQTVTVALVGMHIVGSAKNHREMIWATFEHFGNAPNGVYSYISANGLTQVASNTAGTWLFCAPNSPGPYNNQHMDVVTTPPNITADPPYTISASDTLRTAPFGASDNIQPNTQDQTPALSNSDVIAANNTVLSQLISGDVRANYYLVGATWTFDGANPGGNYDGKAVTKSTNEVGTSQLTNTTMETYVQSPIGNAWSPQNNNCFFCHGRHHPAIPQKLSHIFSDLNPLFPAGATKTAPKKR
jgi:hypothetical protein